MKPHPEELQRAVTRRFGLRPRTSWDQDLPRALQRLRAAHRELPAALPLLPSDPVLLRELAGHLTVEETYFFRNREQIQRAAEHVCAVAAGHPQRQPRVWSAGCSSGEEPYSVAMALAERLGDHAAKVEVVGCDISRAGIERARAGVYGDWAFRGVDAPTLERHFALARQGKRAVRAEYRDRVQFHHLSIQEMAQRLEPASVDVILFRNVGVYLEPEAIQACAAGFARVLRADGIHLQAPTDPPPPEAMFTRCQGGTTSEFRVRSSSTPVPPSPALPAYPDATQLQALRHRSSSDSGQRALRQLVRWAAEVATESAGIQPSPTVGGSLRPPPATRDDILRLADRGRIRDGLQLVERAIALHPHSSDAYLLRAQLRLAESEPALALADLRRVLFVHSTHRLARYWYAVVLARLGRAPQAVGQLKELERQLEPADPQARVEDDETTAADLLRAAAWLRASLE